MTTIIQVLGREILDSRGNPTVEAEVFLADGSIGRAAVPSGASTGEHEAVELRDGDKSRYLGKGTLQAVANVNGEIARALEGMDASQQEALDRKMIELDGTPNKARLGANAILSVSMAASRAASVSQETPLYRYLGGVAASVLPVPMMNIINGGAHADNSVDVQEFMIAPFGAAKFSESLRMGVEVFHNLKKVLSKKGYSTAVGDEGGFAPNLKSNDEALEVVLEAITLAGYKPGEDIGICLDPGRERVLQRRQVRVQEVRQERPHIRTDGRILGQLGAPVSGSALHRGTAWPRTTGRDGSCSPKRWAAGCSWWATTCSSPTPIALQRGIDQGIGNSILIKVNQIGTLTETLRAIQMASSAGYTSVVSHRFRRNRGSVHRRPGGGYRLRPDQDRLGQPHRPHRQVQPVAPDRRGVGFLGAVPGPQGLPAVGWGEVRGKRRGRDRPRPGVSKRGRPPRMAACP